MLSGDIVGKVQDAFNFSVDKFPLAGPDGLRTPWYGLFRSDSNTVVGKGSVTARYQPHQTDDVLALVEASAAAFEGVADVRCYFRNGHYVAVQPTKEHRLSVYGTADNVFPRIIINAGYDGKSFRASMGYYRDLCRNLSIMRMVSGTNVCIRHTNGLRKRMDDLIQTFSVLKESWATLSGVIESMEARRVNMADFLVALYGEPDSNSRRAVTMHRHRTEAIFSRLYNERLRSGRPALQEGWAVSGWEAYNAVQGYVQWDSRRHGNVSDMARIVMAANDPTVARAEELVMAMAV